MGGMGPDRDANLGPVQKHVLSILWLRGESSAVDWAAWYPMEQSQVRSAIYSLGRRGLVDVAGFEWSNGGTREVRTYKLTDAGAALVERWNIDEDEYDEALA